MKAAYLLIDLAVLAFPLIFSFSTRFGFGREWAKAWAAVFLSAIPFAAWDVVFTRAGIWSFNPAFVLGPSLFGLPFEELLFFLAIPFSCLFIYRQFRHVQGSVGRRFPYPFLWGMTALALAGLALSHSGKPYTAAVSWLGALTAALLAWRRPRYSGPLAAAVVMQYLPFLIVNGWLTGLPVVRYREDGILGLRIGTIPVEDAVYSFVMLAVPVAIYEALLAAGRARPEAAPVRVAEKSAAGGPLP